MISFMNYRSLAGGRTIFDGIQQTIRYRSATFYQRKSRSILLRRRVHNAADDPNFVSVVDNPPRLVRSGRKHGSGLILLGKLKAI